MCQLVAHSRASVKTQHFECASCHWRWCFAWGISEKEQNRWAHQQEASPPITLACSIQATGRGSWGIQRIVKIFVSAQCGCSTEPQLKTESACSVCWLGPAAAEAKWHCHCAALTWSDLSFKLALPSTLKNRPVRKRKFSAKISENAVCCMNMKAMISNTYIAIYTTFRI